MFGRLVGLMQRARRDVRDLEVMELGNECAVPRGDACSFTSKFTNDESLTHVELAQVQVLP